MTDKFLKAESEHALYAALESAGVIDAERMVCPGYALDVIGTITRQTGDAENLVIETLDGFHANLRGDLTDEQKALLPVIPAPGNPVRTWL